MVKWKRARSSQERWESSIGEVYFRPGGNDWCAYCKSTAEWTTGHKTLELAQAAVINAEREELQRRAELIGYKLVKAPEPEPEGGCVWDGYCGHQT